MELKEMIDRRNHLIKILTNNDDEFLDMLDEIYELTEIIELENRLNKLKDIDNE